MEKLELKRALARLLRKDISSRLQILLEQERELLKAGNDERYSGDNQYDSTTEETMQSSEYASDLLDHFRRVFNSLSAFPSSHLTEEVQLGAVVITNHNSLFIAADSQPISLDGTVYNTISTAAPLFGMLKGRKKGAEVYFQGVTFRIVDVF
ncbi:MAG: hypothetical protein WDO14_22185 [Bacteroidota bacterium]